MRRAAHGLVPYVIAVLALSSIDITYEWLSPLPPGGESLTPTEWYDGAGLRYGMLMLASREPPGPASGLSFDVHIPVLFPLPFYAGAGPGREHHLRQRVVPRARGVGGAYGLARGSEAQVAHPWPGAGRYVS
jgi:hypothetical protein